MGGVHTPKVLGRLIDDRVDKNRNRVFLLFKDKKITYEEIVRSSNRCANAFQNLGIKKGDKVSIMLPNCPEFLYLWFGLAKFGAVEVPVNTNYKGNFLQHVIDQSDSRILVVAHEFLDRLQLIKQDLSKLEKIVVYGDMKKEDADGLRIPLISFEDFFDSPENPIDAMVNPWDPISIIYTSGTTGVSKGAVASHNYWIVVAEEIAKIRNGNKEDIFFTFMPLYHMNAQVLTTITALVTEAQMALVERFSASSFWDQIRRYQATQFNYLGGVMPILGKQPKKNDDSVNPARIAIGAACPPELLEELEERFRIRCLEGFGMTEIGIPIQMGLNEKKLGSCGKVIEELYEVKLFDDQDNEVALGEIGEIVFRPKKPSVMMLEYYKMPDKTVEAFRNLWFHTGDLARKDEEGYFYFVDRKKDSIRRRGENISSFEVERVVNSHPNVLESSAVAIPSEVGEDEVMIYVVIKPDETLSPEDLIKYCNERMPYFAIPRFVEFLESLPKTPTDRIEKYKLREKGITSNTWDREKAGVRIHRS